MQWEKLTVDELKANIARAANWKCPGPDKLPNFWLKQFTSLHEKMAIEFTEVLNNHETAPDWLTAGNTILLPKKDETWIPKNYRPIACLPTTFKILTSVITDRLYQHLEEQAIMAKEQRGGKKDCYGCKDQLMINNAILEKSFMIMTTVCREWLILLTLKLHFS